MNVSDDSVTVEMDQSPSPSDNSNVASLSARSSYTPTAPVNSKKTQTHFVDDYGRLPLSGHSTQAHVIDMEESARCSLTEEGSIQLQNAIATTLFNVSPETLKSFLSPTVNNFKAIFKPNKSDKHLVIWRKGIEVFVSSTQPFTLPSTYTQPPDRHLHPPHLLQILRIRAPRRRTHRIRRILAPEGYSRQCVLQHEVDRCVERQIHVLWWGQ